MFGPWYVGMSRSGCHWVRITLEGYTDGHSPLSNHLGCINEPIQSMYKRVERGEFKGTHDMELNFQTKHVVYLYRNPIDCIYSNLKYDGTDISNKNTVDYYLNIWIKHIQKWMCDERFTEKKVILCYEKLSNNFVDEFSKLLNFMGYAIDSNKILQSKAEYTKNKIKDIVHDKKVINTEPDYEDKRKEFIKLHGQYIYDKLPDFHKRLWNQDLLPQYIKDIWV